MIGLGMIQGIVPVFLFLFGVDPVFWVMMILFGVLPTLGGVYVMLKWWNSGS
jgi:hypothetical protein